MTRPSRWSLEKAPDTVCRSDGKYCAKCRKEVLGDSAPVKKVPEDQRRATVASLEMFMKDRRARLAKQQTAPVEVERQPFSIRLFG